MDWVLNELEKDLFREIANIGLSKAADSLAVLSKEKVLLSVPDIHIANPDELIEIIAEKEDENAMIVQSDIRGEVEGKSLLLFSEAQVNKFITATLADIGEVGPGSQELRDSVLLEISNIVTGSIITQFANIFDLKIYSSVPKGPDYSLVKSIKNILKELPAFQPLIFTIKTRFLNSGKFVELPLLIVLDTDTMLKLLGIIRQRNKHKFNFFSTAAR